MTADVIENAPGRKSHAECSECPGGWRGPERFFWLIARRDADRHNARMHAADQPRSPYVVHLAGPDDVLEAGSWREAVALAHAANESVVEYTQETEHDGLVRAWATPYLRADAEAAGVIAREGSSPRPDVDGVFVEMRGGIGSP